ncbi:MAG TPA: MFS transporter [Phycisphaerae bacterium]|nr:MFS transporter [Phycisphaerae bacterium]
MTTPDPDPTLPYQVLPLEPAPEPPPEPRRHDPYASLRNVNYRRYFTGNACATFGIQMAGVTVAWELYAKTNSAFALGLVGFVQIVPIVGFALIAGHIVDRFNRRNLILLCTFLLMVSYFLLGLSSHFAGSLPTTGIIGVLNTGLTGFARLLGDHHPNFTNAHVPIMLLLLFFNGCVRAVNQPAKYSIVPMLVNADELPNAITWNSSMFETCNMVGPAVAGGAMAILLGKSFDSPWAYAGIYWFTAFCQLVQFVNVARIHITHPERKREPATLKTMLVGVRFVYQNKIILSTITLDLFAVLLGGATALLPVFAKDILHVGPLGLGILRAAPSVGAITMSVMLAHAPPMKNAGRNMLVGVAGFGIATIVFGLSRNFTLSVVALALTGAFDAISVIVRHSLVQILTPDEMRGRVSAVNSVFISTSNELGEFESGLTAQWGKNLLGPILGPMVAVAAGGVGTVVVVGIVCVLWPQVRKVKELSNPHG